MERPALPPDEVLVRGITTADWTRGTLNPFLFEGQCSFSCTSVLSLDEVIAILAIHLRRPYRSEPPTEELWGYALINVGNLLAWSEAYRAKQKSNERPSPIKVVADPTIEPPPPNPAHALTTPKITRGFSRCLLAILTTRREVFYILRSELCAEWTSAHPPTHEQVRLVSTPSAEERK
jgi:hypothetical protein